jgi:Zn-dependent peptidase ImmA (M78 family)
MAFHGPESHWTSLKRRGASADQLLRHFGIIEAPVPVVWIANEMGVSVYWSDMDDTDGALSMNIETGNAEIFVKSGAPNARMRFTVAHELGHLMLHDFTGVIHRDAKDEYGGPREYQANMYAADLLMPEWMVRHVGRQLGGFGGFFVDILARKFDVSEQAVSIRLQMLGLG